MNDNSTAAYLSKTFLVLATAITGLGLIGFALGQFHDNRRQVSQAAPALKNPVATHAPRK